MKRFWAPSLLVLAGFLTLACGSGNGRQLQSISISRTTNGQQIQFIATGTFSAPPIMVTPLSVDWMLGIPAPPPKQWTYTLTSQPYGYNCANLNPLNPGAVTAIAPTDPNAPITGKTTKVVTASLAFSCQ